MGDVSAWSMIGRNISPSALAKAAAPARASLLDVEIARLQDYKTNNVMHFTMVCESGNGVET